MPDRHIRASNPKSKRRLGHKTRPGEPMAFVRRAVGSTTDDCIIWPYGKNTDGYASVNNGGKAVAGHRLVVTLLRGEPIPEGMEVAHDPLHCTSRACINPRHLRIATRRENELDKDVAGTRPSQAGESNNFAKVTEGDVRAIRAAEKPLKEIAAEFGISVPAVCEIRTRKRWAHVD